MSDLQLAINILTASQQQVITAACNAKPVERLYESHHEAAISRRLWYTHWCLSLIHWQVRALRADADQLLQEVSRLSEDDAHRRLQRLVPVSVMPPQARVQSLYSR